MNDAFHEDVDRGPGEPFDGIEEDYVAPENRCRECGQEAVGMCGCCGTPLCHRHEETQAGFCSDFSDHEFSEGEVLKVIDGLNDLKRSEVEILEDIEVSGCLLGTDGSEKGLFFPMERLPEGADKPESELPMDKVERRPGS